jgi:hypothetical protein
MSKNSLLKKISLAAGLMIVITSCQKLERPGLGEYPKDPANPGGSLKFYTAFENSALDSMRANFATASTITYENGITGKAMKGATGKFVSYGSANDAAKSSSISVSLWINTQKHTGGAECVFMLPRTDDFWGNMFMLIEGNGSATDNTMQIKFHFDGNWFDFNGALRFPNMYGAWHHIVFTYDAGTSTFAAYLDGVARSLPAGMTNVGGGTFGAITFQNESKFILGGYQQHLGSPWNGPDTWMLNYTGLLDQFRIYSKALSASEVSQLFASKL